ncbi:TMEM175 family protein [Arenimonas sp. MALMAid1274]|uniref:TMEM175 family protein n=1 Tax=Arenimonas sp. MALMAid1274 TaxID=3411630 RepID=UPI003B9FBADC
MSTPPGQAGINSADGFRDRGAQSTRLEAFVDAAFAFALTLVVIAGNEIPRSIDALVLAMMAVPTYAASFLLIMRCWSGHADWSRRYGLDDLTSRRLSILLVFLVLIFVYPMRMVFSSLFNALSGGYLPTNFSFNEVSDVPAMFMLFAVAFGLLGAVVAALYWHAWRCRAALSLSLHEQAQTRFEIMNWAAVPMVALLSITLALLIPARAESGVWLGLPGFVFFLLNLAPPLFRRRCERWRKAQAGA